MGGPFPPPSVYHLLIPQGFFEVWISRQRGIIGLMPEFLNKQKLIATGVIVIFVGIVWLLINWISPMEQQERFSPFSPVVNDFSVARESKSLYTKPSLSVFEISEESENNSGFNEFLESFHPIISEVFIPLATKSAEFVSLVSLENPPEQENALSKEEIFDRLWPPDYRNDYLGALEDIMIDDGFLGPSDKHDVIDSDEDVYAILLNTINYAQAKGWLHPDDALKMQSGVKNDLPKDIARERKSLENMGKSSGALLPYNQKFASEKHDTRFFIEDIVEGLKYFFLTQHAYAGWVTSPDCYKDNNPGYIVPGFNALTFCCDCGLNLSCSRGVCVCVWKEHCGPGGCSCTNLGCLNGQCGWGAGPALGPEKWPNAIWDSATGICGCG